MTEEVKKKAGRPKGAKSGAKLKPGRRKVVGNATKKHRAEQSAINEAAVIAVQAIKELNESDPVKSVTPKIMPRDSYHQSNPLRRI